MPEIATEKLCAAQLFRFADWPNPAVPKFGAGIYAVWSLSGIFIYAGMSGRGITATTAPPVQGSLGLHTRLHSHASGRRSGDQFCVHVADRLVLPALSVEEIQDIAAGHHSMDAFVRRYIHEHLGYRFLILADGSSAYIAEHRIRTGAWGHGKPHLNPAKA